MSNGAGDIVVYTDPDGLVRPNHKYSIIRCRRDVDMRDESNWPEIHSWLSNHLEKLRDAFSPLVTDLDDGPTMETDAP